MGADMSTNVRKISRNLLCINLGEPVHFVSCLLTFSHHLSIVVMYVSLQQRVL